MAKTPGAVHRSIHTRAESDALLKKLFSKPPQTVEEDVEYHCVCTWVYGQEGGTTTALKSAEYLLRWINQRRKSTSKNTDAAPVVRSSLGKKAREGLGANAAG